MTGGSRAAGYGVVPIVLLAAGACADPGAAPAVSEFGPARTYSCDGMRFTVRAEGEAVRLFLPDRTVPLPQVPAASGAKYSDGAATFWSRGDEALVETPGRTFRGCRSQPAKDVWEEAKLRGVDFRAVGQEPGWLLEIERNERIVIVADYGERRAVTPAPEPEVDRNADRTIYRAETGTHRLTVTIEGRPCTDTMSGAAFTSTVTVGLDGRTYRGCGKALH